MTTLSERLARRILRGGPLTVEEYMAAALTDPAQGYYRAAQPIGATGDFTTAPEISQIFGELIGAWLIDCWERHGCPDPVRLIELGPGRGVLMEDALRVGARIPAWRKAVDLHLVEINPGLRDAQATRLANFAPHWHQSLATVPDGPTLLVANEFFDALPIRQLVFHDGHWRERLVNWTATTGFHFVLSFAPSPLGMLLPMDIQCALDGDIFELSPAGYRLSAEIGKRVRNVGCAALIIDYGCGWPRLGPTLRGVSNHRTHDFLAGPGVADLSAHVDFDGLGRSALEAGAAVFGPASQGEFLAALGVSHRAAKLKAAASEAAAIEVDQAVQRLTDQSAMGRVFNALAIVRQGFVPTGFSNDGANGVASPDNSRPTVSGCV